MDGDNICSLNASDPLTPSQPLPWVRPQSHDFDLFSSELDMDTAVHHQSIPQVSPKSRALDFDPRNQSHPGNQPSFQVGSDLFNPIDPAQLCNDLDPLLPSRKSLTSHFFHRDSGYEGMDESPNSGMSVPLSRGGLQTISPDALCTDVIAESHPETNR